MFNSYMLVNAQWHNPYTRYHCNACVRCFTQICLVELGRRILSFCVQFRYCLVGLLQEQ
jgi:hypothetical protein